MICAGEIVGKKENLLMEVSTKVLLYGTIGTTKMV